MKEETLKRIFNFLEEKGEHNAPFKWKILNNEPITKEDLKVKGHLILTNTGIETLPEGLKVSGNLTLRNTKINSLPKGLEVYSSLFIENTALLDYTDEELREMIKPGFIDGEIFR